MRSECSVSECGRTSHARGLCDRHYARLMRNGSIDDPRPETPEQRFWAKVDASGDGCWLWMASRTRFGHGKILVDRRLIGAHVFSYAINVGPVPDGMFVCHRCDNPPCVNPEHLWLGTARDNAADMSAKGRAAKSHPRLRGSLNHNAILSEADVLSIRRRIDLGETRRAIAREYHVSKTAIQHAYNGKTWSHVPQKETA